VASTVAVVVGGGYVVPALVLGVLVVPGALIADVLGRVLRWSVVVSLPIAISVALVTILGRAGTTILFTIGPFQATLEGVDFAAQTELRLLALAMTVAVFGLTTKPQALIADLERRGISPRLAFATAATLDAISAMAERARTIQAAQRARGLDTDGSVGARLRGIVPLVAPAVLGTLHEVEARSLALDARAFDRPGTRHLLWSPADSARQRLARWLLLVGLVAFVVGTLTGALPRLR
jgi:energy-coupling factor transport system permease protein